MICGNCGIQGHNKKNPECGVNLITANIKNMYKFVHTWIYYVLSLDLVVKRYPNIFCIAPGQMKWANGVLNGKTKLKYIESCSLPYIFYKFNITNENGSHANYILASKKNKTLTSSFWQYR